MLLVGVYLKLFAVNKERKKEKSSILFFCFSFLFNNGRSLGVTSIGMCRSFSAIVSSTLKICRVKKKFSLIPFNSSRVQERGERQQKSIVLKYSLAFLYWIMTSSTTASLSINNQEHLIRQPQNAQELVNLVNQYFSMSNLIYLRLSRSKILSLKSKINLDR